VWSRNLENEESKARYGAVKIQPQWVVTPGKETNKRCNYRKETFSRRKANFSWNTLFINIYTRIWSAYITLSLSVYLSGGSPRISCYSSCLIVSTESQLFTTGSHFFCAFNLYNTGSWKHHQGPTGWIKLWLAGARNDTKTKDPDFLFQILPYNTLTHDVKLVESSPVRCVIYLCLHKSKFEDPYQFCCRNVWAYAVIKMDIRFR